jgi:hypothetical protein
MIDLLEWMGRAASTKSIDLEVCFKSKDPVNRSPSPSVAG